MKWGGGGKGQGHSENGKPAGFLVFKNSDLLALIPGKCVDPETVSSFQNRITPGLDHQQILKIRVIK